MASVRLGVGCQRQSKVLKLGLAVKPLLLLRDRSRVRPEEGKSVESLVEPEIIHLSGPRLVDDLSRFIETLQGGGVNGEILVKAHQIRRTGHDLPRNLGSFLILPQCA